MFIALNEVCKATALLDETVDRNLDGTWNYRYVTSLNGKPKTSANIYRPMFWYADVNKVCPALIFHSNPLQKDKEVNPWSDVVIQEDGVVFYNGDNKSADRRIGANPGLGTQSGNNKVEGLMNLYKSHSREDRMKAPPILIFEQVACNGSSKGYRAFRGVGVLKKTHIRQQYETNSERVFSNYLFEITLIRLPSQGLNWEWINDRRDTKLSLEQSLRNAPASWKTWVDEGEGSLYKVRQKILHYAVGSPQQQSAELKQGHKDLLHAIIKHYKEERKESRFEALASLIAAEFFGEERFTRGWITPHSGDMGVDFIGRYDLRHAEIPDPPGTVLGRTSLLVIGQAKCRLIDKSEMAVDIARVASRLQRGQIGIYITTGTYKRSVQEEVAIDDYPIILINGRHLADLLIRYMNRTGKHIKTVLTEQDTWYDENINYAPPYQLLHSLIPS